MSLTKDAVRAIVAGVPLPGGRPIGSTAVAKVAYCDGYASVTLALGAMGTAERAALVERVTAAVKEAGRKGGERVNEVHVEFGAGKMESEQRKANSENTVPGAAPGGGGGSGLPGVKHVIAVGAGKGGVGKSTVAVNLAVGLARRGHAVGILDGDIYGPSLPTMLGLKAMDPVLIGTMIQPFYVHGVKAMTIGKLVDPEKPLIWRGPMAHGAFKQLVEQTQWGELDYLIVDLPPGTGDVSLTLAQTLRLTGAVVVCTPQQVAQDDAIRAVRMFQQLRIEVLGVVENMSYFVADDIDPPREYDIFGKGGAERMAQRMGIPFLGAIPITMALRENSDSGDATANFASAAGRGGLGGGVSGGSLVKSLEAMVSAVENQVALASIRSGAGAPTLTIS